MIKYFKTQEELESYIHYDSNGSNGIGLDNIKSGELLICPSGDGGAYIYMRTNNIDNDDLIIFAAGYIAHANKIDSEDFIDNEWKINYVVEYIDADGKHIDKYEAGSIDEDSYSGSSMTSLVIGDGIYSIYKNAFKDCHSLTSITFGTSVEYICENSFENCDNVKSIVFQKNLMGIEKNAFKGCSKLSSVTYKGSVEDWNNLIVDSSAFVDALVTKIDCTDGVITLYKQNKE